MRGEKLVIAMSAEGYKLIGQTPGFAAQFLRRQGYSVNGSIVSQDFTDDQRLIGDFLLHVQPFQVQAYRTGYCTDYGMVGRTVSQDESGSARRDLEDSILTYLSFMRSKRESTHLWTITDGNQLKDVVDLFVKSGVKNFDMAYPRK